MLYRSACNRLTRFEDGLVDEVLFIIENVVLSFGRKAFGMVYGYGFDFSLTSFFSSTTSLVYERNEGSAMGERLISGTGRVNLGSKAEYVVIHDISSPPSSLLFSCRGFGVGSTNLRAGSQCGVRAFTVSKLKGLDLVRGVLVRRRKATAVVWRNMFV
jgi:hypothetical protein